MNRFVFSALVVLFFSSTSFSQIMVGGIASGAGNAGRAAVDPSESSLMNPASVAHLPGYISSVQYGVSSHPEEGEGSKLGFILSDGTPTNLIAGSLSYVKVRNEIDSFSWSGQDLQASAAGFLTRTLAMGVGVHRYLSSAREVNGNQDNANLGFLFTPTKNLGLGLVGYDLFNSSAGVPAETRLKRTYAVAANILILEMFRVRFDVLHQEVGNPERRSEVLTGLESYFRDDFVFRVGAHWHEVADQMLLTAGLGFKGPKLSFDYSFQKDARASEGGRHMFDLWLPL